MYVRLRNNPHISIFPYFHISVFHIPIFSHFSIPTFPYDHLLEMFGVEINDFVIEQQTQERIQVFSQPRGQQAL